MRWRRCSAASASRCDPGPQPRSGPPIARYGARSGDQNGVGVIAVRHLALVGTTASGKSALALEVARRLSDIELLSVDSMQVYRGMDVGTAKPTVAEQVEVRHHLLDLADPHEEFSVTRFQQAAAAAIADIEARGRRALLVGGTGLYLRAVIDNLDLPGQWPDVRAALEAEPDTESLHRRLHTLDPAAAERMEPTNRRRIVRALEVTVGSGRPFSSFGPGLDAHPPVPFDIVGVWLPRHVTADRIARRVDAMVAAGLVDEVHALAARPEGLSHTARQALGYREVLAHVEHGAPLADCLAETVRRTRAFARRQRMWFRRDPRITWYGTEEKPFAVLPALLREWA
ncbi:MAG: tRNA (adenosine(37)-N6)-dimethylallyltransferase MiaA [Actinobacteria bacterium]|nr:tRNA (adenosine(37)-N6)-dimethylallyltransferase MiaA [Actinomycetota bacterium]